MKRILLLTFLLSCSLGFAQRSDSNNLKLDFNLVSLPYSGISFQTNSNFKEVLLNPSMSQSLNLSTDFYSSIHFGIKKAVHFKNRMLNLVMPYVVSGGVDYFVNTLPLGIAWLHEEFHRTVLTKRQITSYNEVYKMKIFQPAIYVSHVTDEGLINLSDNYTNDFKRLMIAGSESTNLNIKSLQVNNFYYHQKLPNLAYYWLTTIGNLGYMKSSANIKFDQSVDDEKMAEGANIENRDFAGPDFTAWVDALFHPNKSYTDRGVHPSGVGIDRYIKAGDLTKEARTYLANQGNLQFLNFISPMMLGFRSIKVIDQSDFQLYGNFSFHHDLTPFGNDISLNIFLQTTKNNAMITLHKYSNQNNQFIGVETSVYNKKLWHKDLKFDATIMAWVQPQNLDFYDAKGKLGGLVQFKAIYSKLNFRPYLDFSLKTDGWVAGQLFLEERLNMNAGISVIF